jgi:hypothetical protein
MDEEFERIRKEAIRVLFQGTLTGLPRKPSVGVPAESPTELLQIQVGNVKA